VADVLTVRIIAGLFAALVLYGLWLHWRQWRAIRAVYLDDDGADALITDTAREYMDTANGSLAMHATLLIPAFTMNWLPVAPVPTGWLILNRSGLILLAFISTRKAWRLRADRSSIRRRLARIREDRAAIASTLAASHAAERVIDAADRVDVANTLRQQIEKTTEVATKGFEEANTVNQKIATLHQEILAVLAEVKALRQERAQ